MTQQRNENLMVVAAVEQYGYYKEAQFTKCKFL
jgi:hypothetical protein